MGVHSFRWIWQPFINILHVSSIFVDANVLSLKWCFTQQFWVHVPYMFHSYSWMHMLHNSSEVHNSGCHLRKSKRFFFKSQHSIQKHPHCLAYYYGHSKLSISRHSRSFCRSSQIPMVHMKRPTSWTQTELFHVITVFPRDLQFKVHAHATVIQCITCVYNVLIT